MKTALATADEHWVCIARLDDPGVVEKAIGPFNEEAAARAHLDDVTARGLIDPAMFLATTRGPSWRPDPNTNVRSPDR